MFALRASRHLGFLTACILAGTFAACTPASTEETPSGTGGSTGSGGSGTGGASSSGGAGGVANSNGTGGSSSGSGGASDGTGGSASGTGGSSSGTGGSGTSEGTGGSASGTGGATSAPDAGGSDMPSTMMPGAFPPGPHKVVLITGDAAHPNDPSRLSMIEILKSMKATHNIDLEEIPAANVKPADMMDKALLIAGPNGNYFSVTPDPGLKTLPVPIMVSKDGKTVGYGIGQVGATSADTNKIVIRKTDHPLAAGLAMGEITVLTTPAAQRIVYFTGLGPDAIKIATNAKSADQWSIFAYEKGGDMGGGVKAPAKRIGFFWHRPAGPTPDGKKLFMAAVEWAIRP
jgi:hypothetical protein